MTVRQWVDYVFVKFSEEQSLPRYFGEYQFMLHDAHGFSTVRAHEEMLKKYKKFRSEFNKSCYRILLWNTDNFDPRTMTGSFSV